MSFLERFQQSTPQPEHQAPIHERHAEIVSIVERLTPPNLDDIATAAPEDQAKIELEWVLIPDPRNLDDAPAIEVQPVLPIGWVEDGSGHGSEHGVAELIIMGKLPNGEIDQMGIMSLADMGDSVRPPYLFLNVGPDHSSVYTQWESADADQFVAVAKSALTQQPTAN